MSVSLACSSYDHTDCARPSCTCWCDHPERATRQDRETELLARPAPLARRATQTVTLHAKPERARREPRPARPLRPRKVAKQRPPREPRKKVLPDGEIIAAYQAGEGSTSIGVRLGVRPSTIRRRLVDAGITLRRRGDRTKRLPDDEIVARYLAGDTIAVLAARHHVATTTITRHLRTHGVAIRPKRVALPVRELVLRYEIGWSIEDLGANYGCSPQTVRHRLIETGVAIRTPGRPGKDNPA